MMSQKRKNALSACFFWFVLSCQNISFALAECLAQGSCMLEEGWITNESVILLKLTGHKLAIGPLEANEIKHAFEDAYRCGASSDSGASRFVETFEFLTDIIDSSMDPYERDGTQPEEFIIPARVTYKTNLCGADNLFSAAPNRFLVVDSSMYQQGSVADHGTGKALSGGCDCQSPTKQEFYSQFNTLIRSFEGSDAVLGIKEIADAETQECPTEEESDWETNIVLKVNGEAHHSEEHLASIGDVVRDSINALSILNEHSCDPYFRRVADVTVEVRDTMHHPIPSDHPNISSLRGSSSRGGGGGGDNRALQSGGLNLLYYFFNVRGKCRGCNVALAWSDDTSNSAGGRMTGPPASVIGSWTSSLLQDNTCRCVVGSVPGTATIDELLETIDIALISGLDGELVKAIEVSAQECDGGHFDTLSTTVKLHVEGEESSIRHDTDLLDDYIKNLYNSYMEFLCDPYFRSVVSSKFIASHTPQGSQSNHMDSVARDSVPERGFVLEFEVVYRCYDCGIGISLFSAQNRNLLFSESTLEAGRTLSEPVEGGQCYCDIHSLASRALTSEEFAKFANESPPDKSILAVNSVST